jgi:hypothetical protein
VESLVGTNKTNTRAPSRAEPSRRFAFILVLYKVYWDILSLSVERLTAVMELDVVSYTRVLIVTKQRLSKMTVESSA